MDPLAYPLIGVLFLSTVTYVTYYQVSETLGLLFFAVTVLAFWSLIDKARNKFLGP